MSKLSVPEAASRLGVSPARVRQRIADGSLVAEKVGGRWLVDLSVVQSKPRRGRPAKSSVVWDAIRLADVALWEGGPLEQFFPQALSQAFSSGPEGFSGQERHGPDLILPNGAHLEIKSSRSSRKRALQRLLDAAEAAQAPSSAEDCFDALLEFMSHRAERHIYRVSEPDFQPLSEDPRLIPSGVSHPKSGLQDPRIVEGYVAAGDLEGLLQDHWLDPVGVDQKPNVVLHVAPGRPSDVSPLMLAADLAEDGGPREIRRAHELLAEALT
ncbi:excisionase family DNA binding protein [Phycicoccus badiiscoriae]|uniref:Excisionase family DNA binding protein n=1 Tax=Pedococcus badiiscoriae TaxID=642776 RepID=A0A852WA29_9MICO|nr:helix-turn-helix domain-containing protein [Pedococcus badiiscoriae]NYG05898.1 excisionase family DNA binding protein [Pedococcus badiiscoriae]